MSDESTTILDKITKGATNSKMRSDQLKEIAGKICNGVGQEFHFRVRRKLPSGGFGFICKITADVDDIEDTLLKEYGDGHYRVEVHYNNGRRIKDIDPIDFIIGDPNNPAPPKRMGGVVSGPSTYLEDGKTIKTPRLAEIEEEIALKKRERELLRAERELRKMETEEEIDTPDIEKTAFEALLEEQRKKAKRYKRRLMMERMSRVDPQVEILKQQLQEAKENARENERRRELEALRAQIESLKNVPPPKNDGLTVKDLIPLATTVVPAITELMKSRQDSSMQMIDAITKVGGLLKDTMPKGLDVDKIVSLAPVVMKLIPRQDMSGVFEMVGNMVAPLIEAAASGGGGGNGDEMAGMLKQVLGTVQKAMVGGQQQTPAFQPPMVVPQAPPQARQRPVAQPQPQQEPPKPKQQQIPIVEFGQFVSKAIRTRNENFGLAAQKAEQILSKAEKDRLGQLKNGEEFSRFLLGQPGLDGAILTTSYAQRWLGALLSEINGTEAEEVENEEVLSFPKVKEAQSVKPAVKVAAVNVAPKIAPKQEKEDDVEVEDFFGLGEILRGAKPIQAPEAKEDKKDISFKANPNAFDYPKDSEVIEVNDFQTLAGPIDMRVELPSKEELERREQERLAMVAKYQNPPEANVKYPTVPAGA